MGQAKGGVMSVTGKRWGHEWDGEKVGSFRGGSRIFRGGGGGGAGANFL